MANTSFTVLPCTQGPQSPRQVVTELGACRAVSADVPSFSSSSISLLSNLFRFLFVFAAFMLISMTPSALYLTPQSQDRGQDSKHLWKHSTGWPVYQDLSCESIGGLAGRAWTSLLTPPSSCWAFVPRDGIKVCVETELLGLQNVDWGIPDQSCPSTPSPPSASPPIV